MEPPENSARGRALWQASNLSRWLGSRFSSGVFYCFFVLFFSRLRFLGSGFVVFFVVCGFSSRGSTLGLSGSRWRSGGRSGVSRERSGRETHSSGNNQS